MDAKIAFGIALKSVRKERKISQEQLALRANIERAHVSKLERGLFQPSLSTIIAIANVLECRPGKLVDMAADILSKQEGLLALLNRLKTKQKCKLTKSRKLS